VRARVEVGRGRSFLGEVARIRPSSLDYFIELTNHRSEIPTIQK